MKAVISQGAIWLALWIILTFSTRAFHPTLELALAATAILELGSAAAVYLNELTLIPALLAKQRVIAYVVALSLAVSIITLGTVFLIQFVYDKLWGPDPRRFGLWMNIRSDLAWIAVHLALGAWIFKRTRHPIS